MTSSTTIARRTRILLALFAGGAAIVTFAACKDATQIDLQLSSNVCVPGKTSYAITVVDPTMKESVSALRPAADSAEPVVVDLGNVFEQCSTSGAFYDLGVSTVVPTRDNTSILVQIALGVDGQRADECREAANNPRCIFARRRIGFVSHNRITVPVFLDGLRCAGKDCSEADKTCFAGGCVSAAADRCSDGSCITEAEQANGGAIPKDAPKPADGGFELGDGATVPPPKPIVDGSDLDVGVGEGSADSSNSQDAAPPIDASEGCGSGTGLGCASASFSGADGGAIAGRCCARVTSTSTDRSCQHPMYPCGYMDQQSFQACMGDGDCTSLPGTTCRLEVGQVVGVCGVVTSCTPPADAGGAGVGRGSGCAMASASYNSCCTAGLDCVKREPAATQGVCLPK